MGGLRRARRLVLLALAVLVASGTPYRVFAQPPTPALTSPVNDFAGIIDGASAQTLDRLIRSLQQASGDVIVVDGAFDLKAQMLKSQMGEGHGD